MRENSGLIFKEKVAFVTGAGSGIGRAAALAFARQGARVTAVDVKGEAAREVADLIQREGGSALAIECDVARSADIRNALDRTCQEFGGLDIAFNNAGIEQEEKPLIEIGEDEWAHIVAVDMTSVFLCMKYQIPLLLKRGSGVIVNTSSGAGIRALTNQAAYTAVRHGVIGLTKTAAMEYAKSKIRVNAICPGSIDTPMLDRVAGGSNERRKRMISGEPIGRLGRPEEIADAVLYLCSDASSFITGHALVVDGGQTVPIP